MENLMIAVNAVVPFVIYMGIGYLIRLLKAGDEAFLNRLNSMVFKIFFPIMLFYNFYTMDLSNGLSGGMVIFMIAAVLTVVGLAFLLVSRTRLEKPKKGVVIQAMFRGNMALFALPLAESVCGEAGKAVASLAVAVSVPLFNVLAVVVLESFHGERTGIPGLLKKVVTNPLILGSIVGLIFLLLKIKLPSFMVKPVSAVSSATTPLALMTLGGTLHFSSVRKNVKLLSSTMGIRMILLPVIMLLVSLLFVFTKAERFEIFILFACPVAVSSYTMAANMGGDGELAGQYVAFSTVACLPLIFIWILVLKTLGIV